MIKELKKIITSFFYIGYIPFAPGTFGSLAALFIYILIKDNFILLISFHILILILGFLLCRDASDLFNEPDSPRIVIDEVNGLFICFLALPRFTAATRGILILITGFIIYRILDIIKPYPANRLQRLNSSLGIMADDIIAAIYTNIILRIVLFF